ncbi:MAG: hypothetical protein RLN88_06965 [Ekhidna sp.]|uniref:hypothetical protein n=1 Tax=Ekhidna sp. TaxID=2608089 RepID=UPI0032ECC8D1
MKKQLLLAAFTLSFTLSFSQYDYEPSGDFPYGRPNPNGPKELNDWKGVIGTCECKSVARLNQTTWTDTVNMIWTFKYIMNGMAVQDETLKEDGVHSGSIRQFNSDSSKWYVHYYSNAAATPTLGSWEGNKTQDGNIVLYKKSPSPNGLDGFYRLTFSEINEKGFNWVGEWVNESETFVYPTWQIFCNRKE